ncbi:hypothetical protein IW261DRAFT_1419573 [Armillaria novae-zelandiae]|uniref:Uncharacterized protein n=1 Tax=Armillaria novae-zelandiae TaxID=153914 RepID=A0AA39PB44_9AGAR|nr:hypothetical protein IW261DRAFT_1419573 [Armillaria novae-zelandiae]
MTNYTELAAQVIPQTKTGLPIRLRSACAYLPMPLHMGWDTDSLTDTSDSTTIPHLKLTDMLSGATREIQASWMHALYKYTSSRHDGVTLLHLKEAGYSSQVSWQHIVIVATLTVQLGFALYGFFEGQEREGWIILLGVLTRCWEVIAHEPAANNNTRVEYINLEDSAVPLPRNSTTSLESSCKARTPLETGRSILDKITAACQATDCVSVGLVEAMLPDPAGEHRDYKWISKVVKHGASNAGLHPTHPEAQSILETSLKRRTAWTTAITLYPAKVLVIQ